MKIVRHFLLGIIAIVFSGTAAMAQSCPQFTYGLVLTAQQWQACFNAKQNVLGYTPLNKAGDVMVGRLVISASNLPGSPSNFNLSVAVADPGVPSNGDIWATSSGFFGYLNNTLFPLGGGAALSNPAALVGLTPVNGVAVTGMRSDGAPALDQSIAPTMTGLWQFSNATASTGVSTGAVRVTVGGLGVAGAIWGQTINTPSAVNVLGTTTASVNIRTTGSNNPELKIFDTTDGGLVLFQQDGTIYLGRGGTDGAWTENLLSIGLTDIATFSGGLISTYYQPTGAVGQFDAGPAVAGGNTGSAGTQAIDTIWSDSAAARTQMINEGFIWPSKVSSGIGFAKNFDSSYSSTIGYPDAFSGPNPMMFLYAGNTGSNNDVAPLLAVGNAVRSNTTVFSANFVVRSNGGTSFTGQIAGTTLTVTSHSGFNLVGVGDTVNGSGVSGGTLIVNQISGTPGENGTYTVNNSQTVGPVAMTTSLTNVKLVGMEIDVGGAIGDGINSGSGGLYINAFNDEIPVAIQIGEYGGAGSWTNGIIMRAVNNVGLGVQAGTTMQWLIYTLNGTYTGHGAILFANTHKVAWDNPGVQPGAGAASMYNDSSGNMRSLLGSGGLWKWRDGPDTFTIMTIAATGQVGIGVDDPASGNGGLQGFVVNNSSNTATRLTVANPGTGASTQAQSHYTTGTANSTVDLTLRDNAGNPTWEVVSGSGVLGAIYGFTNYSWRSQAGTQWMFLQSTGLSVGAAGTSSGNIRILGSTSGTVTQTAQAVAGTPTITWGTSSGTPAVTASLPLVITAATGAITCPTCTTATPSALTKTDDTNVTLTLGGTPTTALLQATSITAGWTGRLALSRFVQGAANTVLANGTSGTADFTAFAMPSCSTAGSALIWTSNTGFGCNTSITAAAVPASGLTGTTLAAGVTASSLTSVGTLTALSVSNNISATASGVSFNAINSNSTQFSGPTFKFYNSAGTMGNQAGAAFFSGISDAGATVGYFALFQINSAGAYVQDMMQYNYNSSTWTFYTAGASRWTIGSTGILTGSATTASTSKITGSIVNSGGFGNAGAIFTDTLNVITMAATAQTNMVCYNTTSGLLTYQTYATGCAVSSRAYKLDINVLRREAMLETVLRFEPVSYHYRPDSGMDDGQRHTGFLAEQIAEVDPQFVSFREGRPNAVKYNELSPVIVGAIQALKADNDNLRAANDNLVDRIEHLERAIAR